jgi:hypothetical protein
VTEALLRFAEIAIGSGGLPGCRRCGTAPDFEPRAGAEVIREALVAIESWERPVMGPGPNISFVGGEPFAHVELPAIIAATADGGASRIRLRSGGEALSVRENAAGVVHSGVRHIEIVLLGDAAEHEDLAARRGAFAALVGGARAFLDSGRSQHADVVISGLVPVCRHNLAYVPSAVARLAELGASEVVLDVEPHAASSVDAATWLASACDTGIVNGAWVAVRAPRSIASVPSIHQVGVASGRVRAAESTKSRGTLEARE